MTRVSCSRMCIVCFQDPEVDFRGIRNIYNIIKKKEPIFDLAFPKRHGFVALISCLKGFEYFLY